VSHPRAFSQTHVQLAGEEGSKYLDDSIFCQIYFYSTNQLPPGSPRMIQAKVSSVVDILPPPVPPEGFFGAGPHVCDACVYFQSKQREVGCDFVRRL